MAETLRNKGHQTTFQKPYENLEVDPGQDFALLMSEVQLNNDIYLLFGPLLSITSVLQEQLLSELVYV